MSPCDAWPDDTVIAGAIERFGSLAPRLVPPTLKRKWAGLRTFSPDSVPVVGEDPRVRGFFWLAGQAGFGIESSPAIGAIAADLLVQGATDRFDQSVLSPARFDMAQRQSLRTELGNFRQPHLGAFRSGFGEKP